MYIINSLVNKLESVYINAHRVAGVLIIGYNCPWPGWAYPCCAHVHLSVCFEGSWALLEAFRYSSLSALLCSVRLYFLHKSQLL